MSNVIAMGGGSARQAAQPVPSVIALLEDVLERARSGNVQHVAVCWIEADGSPIDAHAPGGNVLGVDIVSLIGSLEVCKTTIATQIAMNHLEPLRE